MVLSLYGYNSFSKVKKPKFISNQKTGIKNPFEMRDPFKRRLRKIGRSKKTYGGFFYNNALVLSICHKSWSQLLIHFKKEFVKTLHAGLFITIWRSAY